MKKVWKIAGIATLVAILGVAACVLAQFPISALFYTVFSRLTQRAGRIDTAAGGESEQGRRNSR